MTPHQPIPAPTSSPVARIDGGGNHPTTHAPAVTSFGAAQKLRVLDLFSGIGGFSLGLERTGGFETVAFCEIEEFPRRVLAKHWPEVPCYHDVATADFAALGPVDLVTAGFPCQDVSLAGKGAGLAGERSGLFWHILRAVRMVGRPKLLLENVAALLDRGMGSVLGALAQVGYDAEWHCIPASYVGAWHQRDRVWIFADANEKRCKGSAAQPILRQSDLSLELVRGFAQWPGRSNLPASRFCSANDGVPNRVDRIAAAGNAVVPQIPELIGRAILAAEFGAVAGSSSPRADAKYDADQRLCIRHAPGALTECATSVTSAGGIQ